MAKRDRRFIALLCAAVVACPVGAADLGVVGPDYEIREPDFVKEIVAALREKEQSGELARLQAGAKARLRAAVETPVAVPALDRATEASTRYFDPTLTFTENVVNERGEVVVPAGTTINPADYIGLKSRVLFFDARDARQLAYARNLMKTSGPQPPRLVLVAGSPIPLIREFGVRVYFDQRGYLSSTLGVKRVPTMLSQEGRLLRIDEIPVGG